MIKVKQQRTADCVVGGFRYAEKKEGRRLSPARGRPSGGPAQPCRLHLCASPAKERVQSSRRTSSGILIEPPGFTGNAPGGPSRWNTGRSMAWEPLRPVLVVEVRYDQVTGRRFRHGTRSSAGGPTRIRGSARSSNSRPSLSRPSSRHLSGHEPFVRCAAHFRPGLSPGGHRPWTEHSLIAHLAATDLSPFRFQGWLGNRKTKSFGWRYDFDDASFSRPNPFPNGSRRSAKPPRRSPVCARRISSTCFSPVTIQAPESAGTGTATCSRRSSGSRSDRRPCFASDAARPGGFDRASVDLEPRSIYLLSGEARWDWEHRITPGDRLRFSITFRALSDKGRRIAAARR